MPFPDSPQVASGPDHPHGSHAGHTAAIQPDQEFWDERYRSHPSVWSGDPNTHLVSEAADLTPGTALDVGAGEGADALWLAERGWQVTATDISTIALDRGASHAREAGADIARRIEWLHADLTTWVPTPMTYDLVSAQFMHLPKAQRDPVFVRLAASVAAGGTLLIVGHHPSDLQTTIPRPPMPELFFTAADIADTLNPDEWDIVVSDTRARNATDPDGRPATIHDAVLRAQRRGRSGQEKPVVLSAVWPVPRMVVIPRGGDEPTMLKGYLDHYRETFELKCAGVASVRMSERSSPPSTMSLHGLARHLAGVERWWFAIHFAGLDLPMLYYSDDDPDQDFESLDGDPLDALKVWRVECERSRRIVDDASSLDDVGAVERNGSYTLRWLMLRMIAEYAQHAGHADLLREGIDGAVGA